MQICENLIKLYANGYLRLFSLKCNISGIYPLPKGPKIIAANHPNATDSFNLVTTLDETPRFLMRSNLFSIPIIGWLLNNAGQIEVSAKGKISFEYACAALLKGQIIVLYPEGKLNPEYEKLKAKSGAVRMSLATGVPITPLGIYVQHENIIDMRRVLNGTISKGCWQVSGSCFLRFGRPWMPKASGTSLKEIHKLSRILMNQIYSLVNKNHKELTCESPTSLNPILQW
ncbi:MAG: lysophospholipid acyltransferase family protein [Anaerolineae bacterium]|nr:lysophospholipid acyltransferase family protein [Anaerolineae bacterium]